MKSVVCCLMILAFVVSMFAFVDTSEACGPAAFVGPVQAFGAPVAAVGLGRQVTRATPFRPFVGPVTKTFAPRGAAFVAPQAIVVPQQVVVPQAIVQQVPTSQFSFSAAFIAPQAFVAPACSTNCQAFFR